jgi:hypothetical protein
VAIVLAEGMKSWNVHGSQPCAFTRAGS